MYKEFPCTKYTIIDDNNCIRKNKKGRLFYKFKTHAEKIVDKHDHLRIVEVCFKELPEFTETMTDRVARVMREIEYGE